MLNFGRPQSDYLLLTAIGLIAAGLWFSGFIPADRHEHQRAVLQGGASLLLANPVYFRPRPFFAHDVNLLFYRPTDSSLPRNPAAAGFSVAVAVWITHRRAGMAMLALATLWSLARIYCGVHYPRDIAAVAAVGSLTAHLVDRFIDLGERLFMT
jgi:undecaprenyl-diphosphatase